MSLFLLGKVIFSSNPPIKTNFERSPDMTLQLKKSLIEKPPIEKPEIASPDKLLEEKNTISEI